MTHDDSYYLRRVHQCATASHKTRSWTTRFELLALQAYYLKRLTAVRCKNQAQAFLTAQIGHGTNLDLAGYWTKASMADA
jgi:hypothetical protein